MDYKAFEPSLLLEQFRGDEEILLEVISIFMEGQGEIIKSIKEAIDQKDAEKLRINAHTLKGIIGNFYAVEGAQMAAELEKCGVVSDFQKASGLLGSLDIFMKDFLSDLEILKKSL